MRNVFYLSKDKENNDDDDDDVVVVVVVVVVVLVQGRPLNSILVLVSTLLFLKSS